MGNILSGLVLVNGTDIWTEYGVFLVEDRRGGMENLTAILTPSKAKKDTAVDIREEHGEKYSPVLTPRNEARDVTLHFALYNKTQAGWMKQYFAFVNFLKQGKDGWLQGDNVLSLSFSYYAFLPLDVNDYTDYLGERYWLTERYTPKQVSDGEWEYNLKLYGIESLIKRFLVLETTDGDTNPLFTLTATPREHVAMVVKAINNGMGHITDWKTGTVEGTELITIDYEGMYCDEALKAIAEKAGGKVEWWVEGQTVNVCRCEHGEEITLGYGKGLTSLERDTSNTAKFYTRLFPVGSTRNIDAEKYGSPRLMLL